MIMPKWHNDILLLRMGLLLMNVRSPEFTLYAARKREALPQTSRHSRVV